MKTAIVGVGFFTIFILTVTIVMALIKDNRESEKLAEAVELAVYQSLQEGVELQEDPGGLFYTNIEVLLQQDEYTATIIESNCEKGILKAKVELSYKNMGNPKVIEVERTVIYEREVGEAA